jgi:hypothetical protein
MKVTGELDAPEEAQRIVGKWLLRAMLTLYFKSIREALHPGETPLGVAYLMKLDVVKETVSDRTTEGS